MAGGSVLNIFSLIFGFYSVLGKISTCHRRTCRKSFYTPGPKVACGGGNKIYDLVELMWQPPFCSNCLPYVLKNCRPKSAPSVDPASDKAEECHRYILCTDGFAPSRTIGQSPMRLAVLTDVRDGNPKFRNEADMLIIEKKAYALPHTVAGTANVLLAASKFKGRSEAKLKSNEIEMGNIGTKV